MFSEVLIAIFLLCVTAQLGYVLYFFVHIFSVPRAKVNYSPSKRVSVIICAQNEKDNLKDNLPLILSQRYTNDAGIPLYEVVVVNDASDDGTKDLLSELAATHNYLKVVDITVDEERKFKGKKFALSKGVEFTENEILVLTDADCTPNSDSWLKSMAEPFHNGKELVLGYGGYRTSDSLLNAFIRWETVHSFLQYASYAIAGQPYMGVGRNMACTKGHFKKAQTSAAWNKLPSGDDDLLVQSVTGREKVAVIADRASFTNTNAANNWQSWYRQKSRHLSTGKYYRWFTKLLLAEYGFTHALLWISFIVLLFVGKWEIALGVMAMRSLVYWLLWWHTACILGEKNLIRFIPLFDFGWMVYNFAFAPYIFWKNKQQWT